MGNAASSALSASQSGGVLGGRITYSSSGGHGLVAVPLGFGGSSAIANALANTVGGASSSVANTVANSGGSSAIGSAQSSSYGGHGDASAVAQANSAVNGYVPAYWYVV